MRSTLKCSEYTRVLVQAALRSLFMVSVSFVRAMSQVLVSVSESPELESRRLTGKQLHVLVARSEWQIKQLCEDPSSTLLPRMRGRVVRRLSLLGGSWPACAPHTQVCTLIRQPR